MRMNIARFTVAGTVVVMTAFVRLAIAAEEADAQKDVLEEIVVTSTKQAEALSKVPISIAAYTQESLEKQNIVSFEDIADMTPGVTFSHRGSGNSHRTDISIRGISAGPGTATTGVYIDETPIQIRPDCCVSSNPYPRIFDLERVEILRGPQGTLYGAGSMGGTIRFITPEPSLDQLSVRARGETAFTEGGDPTQEMGFAVGGPVAENALGFRVSAYYRKDGGYVDHINRLDQRLLSRNADWSDALVLRGALKWAVNDSLTVAPSVLYQREKIADSSLYWEAFSDPSRTDFNNANPVVTPVNDNFFLPVLKIDWRNDALALVSNTSYFERENINTFDDTMITTAIFAGVLGPEIPQELAHVAMPGDVFGDQEIFTQELRLQNADPEARLNWVAGVFYQHVTQAYHYKVDAHQLTDVLNYGNEGPPITVEDALGMGLYQDKYILFETEDTRSKEIAVYGNVDFHLTEKLTLIAGLRYSSNKYESDNFQAGPVVSSADGFWIYSSTTDKPVTPKFGVSYQANDNNMFYLTASKGYRQGFHTGQVASRCQADLDALGVSGAARDIKSDSVWNYEVGSKSRLAGGRVQIDASIYRIDWTDIQSALSLPCGNTWRGNLGKARSAGFDLNFAARVADSLTVGLALGYANAEYTEAALGAADPVTGARPIIRPKREPLGIAPWTVVTSAQYDFDLLGRSAYFRADHRYSSHDSTPLATMVSATDPTIPRDPASSNLDMRFGFEFGSVEMSLFGANLTNQHPEFNRSRPFPPSTQFRGMTVRPRTFGLTAIYRM